MTPNAPVRGSPPDHPETIRPAAPADEARIAELFFGSPSAEAAALAGGAGRAVRLGKALFLGGVGRSRAEDLFVAARGSEVIGAFLARTDGTALAIDPFSLPAAMAAVLEIYPPCELPGLLGRSLLRALLELPVPAGSYHIAEVHVDPRERGRGVGTRLVEHAVARASERGHAAVSLVTAISNPARRLYERLGFSVTDARALASYEALTGTPGRMLMQKRLR